MFNLFNSKKKIQSFSERNGTKKYTLVFSRKKDSCKELLRKILGLNYIYVHIDTSLCFLNYDQAEKKSLEVIKILEDCAIDFNHRISEDTSNRDNIFGAFKVSNIQRNCNIITFILPKNFSNDLLINKIFEVGCMIYAPLVKDNDNKEIIVNKLFLNNFKSEDEKNDSFRYYIFLADLLPQFTITTKWLTQSEVAKIFLEK